MRVRFLEKAVVYSERDPASALLAELEKGAEVELGTSTRHGGKEWLPVTLSDGRSGFLGDPARVIALENVVLDQTDVSLLEAPETSAKVRGTLVKNEAFLVLEVLPSDGPGWSLVRHPTLGEGYVPGNTRIRPANVPELTWARSFWIGAKIITGLGTIGALYLLIQGEAAGAILLLLVSFLAGGVAGMVYFGTTALREREFGPYLSWGLVFAAYFFMVGLLLYLAGLTGYAEGVTETSLFTPVMASGFIGACIVIGLILGYQEQRERHREDGRAWRLGERLVPLFGGVGLAALLLGLIWWRENERDWPLVAEASEPAQPMSLRQFLLKGHGENRYLLLNGYRHAEQWVVQEVVRGDNYSSTRGWAILVPATDQEILKGLGESIPVPKKALTVLVLTQMEEGKASPGPGPFRPTNPTLREELVGRKVMVLDGMAKIPARVRQGLAELAPNTDFERVHVLSAEARPIAEEVWQDRRAFWLGAMIAGAVGLGVSLGWGSRSRGSQKPG